MGRFCIANIIITILFLAGCQSRGEEVIYYDVENVSVYQCSVKDTLPVDEVGVMMMVSTPRYLVTMPVGENFLFRVYDKKDFSLLGEIVPKGRGPEEVNSGGYINQWEEKDGHLKILLDCQDESYVWVDVDLALAGQEGAVKKRALYPSKALEALKAGITTIASFSDDSLLVSAYYYLTENELKAKVSDYYVYYPKKDSLSEPYPWYKLEGECSRTIYNMMCDLAPNQRYLAHALSGLKRVQIFNLQNREITNVEFPGAPTMYEQIIQGDIAFGALRASEHFIWIVEVDGNILEPGTRMHRIYVLDWEGNPCCTLEVAENILSFVPDEAEKALYVVDRERGVYRYDLSVFFDQYLPKVVE